MYTLATIDFLVEGGDDMGWAFDQIPDSRKRRTDFLMRDVFVDFIKKNQPINPREKPVIDPAHPRLVRLRR